MLLIGLYCRWNNKDNSIRNLGAYYNGNSSCYGTEKSSKLKCSGSTLGPMKLPRIWPNIYGICILHCFSIEAKEFWYFYIYIYVWLLL